MDQEKVMSCKSLFYVDTTGQCSDRNRNDSKYRIVFQKYFRNERRTQQERHPDMEWEYPKAPDWRDVMDMITPINVADWIPFALRIVRLGEEVASEVLNEALAAVYQVDVLQREMRRIDSRIRQLAKSRKPDAACELMLIRGERLALQHRGIPLRDALRRPRFGNYFPRTRHNLFRKMVRFVVQSAPQTSNSKQNLPQSSDFGSTLCSPGHNPVISSSSTLTSLLQSTQSQAEMDISVSFWQDKMTTLQNFIAEGKI